MEQVKVLERKIHLVVEKIAGLEKQNKKLADEVKLVEDENQRLKQLASESVKYREERKSIENKVEKLIKRIEAIKNDK